VKTVHHECDKEGMAGTVSQRACVFCGSRVVLYPIADALHLVHGPTGGAAISGKLESQKVRPWTLCCRKAKAEPRLCS